MNNQAEEFWNQRYRDHQYAYGVEPNEFLKAQLPSFTPGRILFPAEGEGRNALFAAKHGWQVDAFDMSVEGRQKAADLFRKHNVTVEYTLSEFENFNFKESHYDMVASIFAHTDPLLQKVLLQKYSETLRPGGILMIVGFSKQQLQYQSGGPKSEDWLYNLSMIDDLPNCEIIHAEEIITNLNEGLYHQGKGSVIQILAKKIIA